MSNSGQRVRFLRPGDWDAIQAESKRLKRLASQLQELVYDWSDDAAEKLLPSAITLVLELEEVARRIDRNTLEFANIETSPGGQT